MDVTQGAAAPAAQAPTAPVSADPTVITEPVMTDPTEPSAPIVTEPEEDPAFTKRFAALTRRERALQERERLFREQQAEVERLRQSQQIAKTDPLAFLQAHGLTYQEITDHVLNNGEPTAEFRVRKLEEQIERERQERERQRQEDRQKEIDTTISGFKSQVKSMIDQQGDTYELIRSQEAYDTVFETIEAYFAKTGQILDVDVAAKHVEEELEQHARKILGLKRFAPKEPQPLSETLESAVAEAPVPPPPATPPKTLTAAQTTGAAPLAKPGEVLSEDESKRRAAQLLRWT